MNFTLAIREAWRKTVYSSFTYLAMLMVGVLSLCTVHMQTGYIVPFIVPFVVQFFVRLISEIKTDVSQRLFHKPQQKICLTQANQILEQLSPAQGKQHLLIRIDINIATEVIRLTADAGLLAEHNLIMIFERHINEQFPNARHFSLDCDSFVVIQPGDEASNQEHLRKFKAKFGNLTVREQGMKFFPKLLIGTTPLTDDIADSMSRLEFAARKARFLMPLQTFHIGENHDEYTNHKKFRMRLRSVRQALHNQELGLFVQPIISLNSDGELPKYEVLLRHYQSKTKIMSPMDILEPAHFNRISQEIDLYVVELLCQHFKSLFGQRGEQVSTLAINISGNSFGIPSFASVLDEIVTKYGVPKNKLVLEVTEDIASSRMIQARNSMNSFREKGFKLALDDIGTGSSNFQNLRDLPVDFFKIDRSYSEMLLTDKPTYDFVKLVIDVAKLKGKKVIAEGIPNEDVKRELIRMGVDYSQSFITGRPRELIKAPKYHITQEIWSLVTEY
ncbi:MAG: EAL domain-containing protein [Psychrobium sp.]